MADIDDIVSEIKSGKAKDSGAVLKPRPTVRGLAFPNEKTNEYEAPLRPPSGGVDQDMAKSRKDNYIEIKKLLNKGGSVRSSASKRADGIATKGHTKGRCL